MLAGILAALAVGASARPLGQAHDGGDDPSAEVPLAQAGGAVVERRLAAMGTHFDLEVTGTSRAAALRASESAVRAVETCAQRLSTWSGDSELAALNAAPVGHVVDGGPLVDELARCLELQALTDGAFDPSIGALVAAWDLRGGGRIPSDEEILKCTVAGGLEAVVRVESGSTRVLRKIGPGHIEEGGFGKGAGLDQALAALAAEGVARARLDLGGQVAVLATDPEAEPFEVALADPLARTRPVLVVELQNGSLATTGNSERGITVDGRRFAHVLDPRTGRPATDFGSLSVWSSSAFRADALSTGLYVLGPEEALAWAEGHDDVEVIVLEGLADGSLRARTTTGFEGRVRATSDVQLVSGTTNPDCNPLSR